MSGEEPPEDHDTDGWLILGLAVLVVWCVLVGDPRYGISYLPLYTYGRTSFVCLVFRLSFEVAAI